MKIVRFLRLVIFLLALITLYTGEVTCQNYIVESFSYSPVPVPGRGDELLLWEDAALLREKMVFSIEISYLENISNKTLLTDYCTLYLNNSGKVDSILYGDKKNTIYFTYCKRGFDIIQLGPDGAKRNEIYLNKLQRIVKVKVFVNEKLEEIWKYSYCRNSLNILLNGNLMYCIKSEFDEKNNEMISRVRTEHDGQFTDSIYYENNRCVRHVINSNGKLDVFQDTFNKSGNKVAFCQMAGNDTLNYELFEYDETGMISKIVNVTLNKITTYEYRNNLLIGITETFSDGDISKTIVDYKFY